MQTGRKRDARLRPLQRRRLWSGDSDAGESSANRLEQVGKIITERLRTDRDRESYKYYQHRIFGGRGAAVILTKATDQTGHFNFLLLGS